MEDETQSTIMESISRDLVEDKWKSIIAVTGVYMLLVIPLYYLHRLVPSSDLFWYHETALI